MWGLNMKLRLSFLNLSFVSFLFLLSENLSSQENQQVFEEVIVTAEKRDESLQTISQAVTAITESEIEDKNITSSTSSRYNKLLKKIGPIKNFTPLFFNSKADSKLLLVSRFVFLG